MSSRTQVRGHPPARPDARAPFVLDTRSLGRRAGTMRELRRTVPAPSGLGDDVVGIPAGSDLDLDLRIEAVVDGILVSGHVHARLTGECSRCLDPVRAEVDGPIQELYTYDPQPGDPQPGDGDSGVIVDDLIDLRQAVHDALLLALPVTPLCRVDCPGLCATCGARLADVAADHEHPQTDPRWQALSALLTAPTDQES